METPSASCGQVTEDTKNVRHTGILPFTFKANDCNILRGGYVVKLLLVMPATNLSSERTFSALCPIKTYVRTTMTHTRLNYVMVLHVYNNRKDLFKLGSNANDFISDNERRLRIFWKIF